MGGHGTPVTNYDFEKLFNADYPGSVNKVEFMDLSTIRAEAEKMATQAWEIVPGYTVTMHST